MELGVLNSDSCLLVRVTAVETRTEDSELTLAGLQEFLGLGNPVFSV